VQRALTCLIAALALAGATVAAAADSRPLDSPLVADLDADGTVESVRAHETGCFDAEGATQPPCADDVLRTFYVEVADTCARGPVALKLSREMEFVSLARIVDADLDGRPRELAFEARAGAAARAVQAKIVRFRAAPGGCIAVAKTLFSYPRPATIGKRPKGTSFAGGAISLADFDRSRPGLELRTIATYARPTDAGCCPSYRRTTHWRFVTSTSTYRPYRTKLQKLRRR
jgi:hypothetical protein